MTSGNTANNDADDDDDETLLAKKRKKHRLVLIKEKLISLNNNNNVGKYDDDDDNNNNHQQHQQHQQHHLKHPKNLDHYSVGKNIYLQCPLYASLLEEEMPVEIWTGSSTTTIQHRMGTVTGTITESAAGTGTTGTGAGTASVNEIQSLWKMGIVMKVHRNDDDDANQTTKTVTETIDTINSHITCDVSYLKDINDDDETIERKVDGTRLRILLGCDDMIPSTVEEARVALLGAEEGSGGIGIEDATSSSTTSMPMHISAPVMDEDTGLSSWTTTSVRKVTVSQQVKEERARARAKRKEQFEKQEQEKKDAQGRKMEEERYVNAHDSALGAYDVWSSAGRVGYKGVQIGSTGTGSGGANDDAAVGLGSSASGKLAANNGRVGVRFKKRNGAGAGGSSTIASKFKRAQKKQNRRKTFADDSDED